MKNKNKNALPISGFYFIEIYYLDAVYLSNSTSSSATAPAELAEGVLVLKVSYRRLHSGPHQADPLQMPVFSKHKTALLLLGKMMPIRITLSILGRSP